MALNNTERLWFHGGGGLKRKEQVTLPICYHTKLYEIKWSHDFTKIIIFNLQHVTIGIFHIIPFQVMTSFALHRQVTVSIQVVDASGTFPEILI